VDPRLAPLYEIFKLNSHLFLNCLEGMSEDQARWRPSAASNSAAFIAAHLVDARHYLAGQLGLDPGSPFEGRLDAARTIDEVPELPTLEQIRGAWKDVTGSLRERFKQLSAADLDRPYTGQYPIQNRTALGLITFLMQHDSHHVGQLGFLRKQVGLPAMRYT
jgi:uncharacterized damage-inducible protein DinB